MPEIITEADMLMEILAQKGEAPISLIAHVIGVDEDVVENWAGILEKHGLVDLRYPILGKPVVEFEATEKVREEFRKRFIEAQRKKADLALKQSDRVKKDFENIDEETIHQVEREVKGELNKVRGLLNKLEEVSEKLEVIDQGIKEDYDRLIDKYEGMLEVIEKKKGLEAY